MKCSVLFLSCDGVVPINSTMHVCGEVRMEAIVQGTDGMSKYMKDWR